MRQRLNVLQLVEPFIVAVAFQQRLVRALFDDAPFVQHNDTVDIADGREAVGDDNGGTPAHQLFERVLNQRLGFGIDAAGGLIQDQQNLRIEGDGARKGEQLALARREARPALQHWFVVPLGQPLDKLGRVDEARRLVERCASDSTYCSS